MASSESPGGYGWRRWWQSSSGRKTTSGTEPCARPQRSGLRRSGGKSTTSNEEGKVWHPGPIGSLTACFPVR